MVEPNVDTSYEESLDLAARQELWRRGELCSWKLEPHQLEVSDLFEEWDVRRQTAEYSLSMDLIGATLDDVWVEMLARRFGKTAKWIIKLTQKGLERPGAVFTYATAYQKDIAEIIVPLANILLADGPDELRPKYQGTKLGSREGLFFPNGSVIRLVGIDEHPDALRGRFSDGFVISEAGFVKDLEETVRSVILPQFQRRPHAFLALESSCPKQPGHDFLRVFVPDAKLRKAFVERDIDSNTALSQQAKEKFLRQSGGRGHPTCEREYYNRIKLDTERAVVPEFDPAKHVVSRETVAEPAFFQAYTSADPGSRDLFGLVFAYWDFLRAKLVVQRSWAARNAPTRRVAAVVAAIEYELWGVRPHPKMASLPLGAGGWAELLRGEPNAHLAPLLYEMAQEDQHPSKWRERPSDPRVKCYWDGSQFRAQPAHRSTDIDLRLIQDVSIEYGILFSPTAKDDAEAQRNVLRDAIGAGKVEFYSDAGPVIDHVQNAEWNDKRTDYERHPVFGHYDCLAALIYLLRNVSRSANPAPPEHIGTMRIPTIASHRWHMDQRKPNRSGVVSLQDHLAGRQWR